MTSTLTKQIAQTCQWRGIPIAGIDATGPCIREATLTGQSHSGSEQHLCTQHMRQRRTAGYGYTWVWPNTANGFVRYAKTASALGDNARALSTAAVALTR